MGNYNNNRTDRDRGTDTRNLMGPQMHQATCSKCGKSCMVPFRPTGNRPIFCSDCFKTESGNMARRTDDRTQSSPSDRQMYDAICSNCGNRCQIPFQPRPGKQVFCSHCFEQKEKGITDIQERPRTNNDFVTLNTKLDKILQLLSTQKAIAPSQVVKAQEEKPEVKEELAEEPVKKAPTKKKAAPKKKSSAK